MLCRLGEICVDVCELNGFCLLFLKCGFTTATTPRQGAIKLVKRRGVNVCVNVNVNGFCWNFDLFLSFIGFLDHLQIQVVQKPLFPIC